ncbi:MAG TPA: helix-turn-helix domain-containing protein [Pseudonocardia sp.]|nr:helix-turn-helix domain-containing protein [Pseudonocardia sp.]
MIELSTSDVPAPDRLAYWCDHVCDVFVELQVGHLAERPLRGRIAVEDVDVLRLATVATTPQEVRRTPRLIARSEREYLAYGVLLQGEGLAAQDGREALLTPGTGVFYDTTRPYTLRFGSSFSFLVALAPRSVLGRLAAAGEVCARPLGPDLPVAALVSPFLRNLADQGGRLGPEERVRLGATAEALLAAAVASVAGSVARPDAVRTAQRLRAERFVEENLADPGLGPADVAEALGVSLRYVHRLFEDGPDTVAALIRERRLAGAREALADPRQHRRTVASIAAGFGFRDAGQLARAFRARYGTTPREFRARAGR